MLPQIRRESCHEPQQLPMQVIVALDVVRERFLTTHALRDLAR
jgi:hypothetical protein